MELGKQIQLKYDSLRGLEDLVALLNQVTIRDGSNSESMIRMEDLNWCLRHIDDDFVFYSFEDH
jgi:hypothetical protein